MFEEFLQYTHKKELSIQGNDIKFSDSKTERLRKQRLNLIRGILINKEIYFFDEPTSNLDMETEEKIINMINKYLKDKTYVIVTHRPKLKNYAINIIFLKSI